MSAKRRSLGAIAIIEAILLLVLICIPFLFSDFSVTIITRILILALLAISFDLCWGYSGILSFGQALFFGVSAYAVTLLANNAGLTQIWIILPVGMAIGFVLALTLAWCLLLGKRRPEPIFVAVGTLTASYAAERLVAGWQWVGAGNGMSVSPFLQIGSYDIEPGPVFYCVAVVVLLIVYLASRYLVRSQFGLVLAGMRQNEERLSYLGYRAQLFKALVFSFAGMIAGLAGSLYAFHEGFVGPGSMGFTLSTYVVLYALFGGAGTLVGPIIGVAVIEGLSFALSDFDSIRSLWPVILGAIMLVVVVYKPTGILGFVVSQREKVGSFGPRTQAPKIPRPGSQVVGNAAGVTERSDGVA